MNEITEFLKSIWQLFTDVTVPGLDISFAELWIGVFVISVSIMLLRPLFGVGAVISNTLSKGISNSRQRINNIDSNKYHKKIVTR